MLPGVGYESGIAIGYYLLRPSMEPNQLSQKQVGEAHGGETLFRAGNPVGPFGEGINDGDDHVIPCRCLREFGDKIDVDSIPPAFGGRQRLNFAKGAVIDWFDA